MTDFLRRFGQWGMVAGAAEGLGASFCEELARQGMNVILVDINEKGMKSLSLELESAFQIKTRTLTLDLSLPDAHEHCLDMIRETGCRLLVYNAAFSRVKTFLSAEEKELDQYLNVNVFTPLRLVYAFTRELKTENKTGGILLMSSLAGIWGTQLVAVYSGTKAFNRALAEALHHELKPSGILVSACCAGATATPGYLGSDPATGFGSPPLMHPRKVARIALKNLGKQAVIIPGFTNKLSYFILTRLLPRNLSISLVNGAMGRTYSKRKLEIGN